MPKGEKQIREPRVRVKVGIWAEAKVDRADRCLAPQISPTSLAWPYL